MHPFKCNEAFLCRIYDADTCIRHYVDEVTDHEVNSQTSPDGSRIFCRPLDAALVSPGTPTPFPNPDRRPDLARGMHTLLANNIWCELYRSVLAGA
jgi:hypothetical protein